MNKGQHNRTVSLKKQKNNKRTCILRIKLLLQCSFVIGMIFCVHSFRKIFAEFDDGKSTTIEDPAVVKKTQAIENPTLIKNDLTGTFYNAEILWIKLVEEIAKKKNPGIIIEVGMWSLLQCTFSSILVKSRILFKYLQFRQASCRCRFGGPLHRAITSKL